MVFVIVGVLLLLMKWTEFGPVASLAWYWVLAPFGLAIAWWGFADSSGLTQRRAIRRMEERTVERRARNAEALGLVVDPKGRVGRRKGAEADGKKKSEARRAGDKPN